MYTKSVEGVLSSTLFGSTTCLESYRGLMFLVLHLYENPNVLLLVKV